MINLFAGLPDQLIERAASLQSLGMKEGYAWNLADARKVMECMHKNHPEIIVLGGDVLRPIDDGRSFEYIYANWSFEPTGSSEDSTSSILQANKFFDHIEEVNPNAELFVDLVVNEPI